MRSRRSNGGDNYDSVLDTMTNVVGILIIVVAVTQVSVGDIGSESSNSGANLPEVSPETLAAARSDFALLTTQLSEARSRWGKLDADAPRKEAELREVDNRLRLLRAQFEEAAGRRDAVPGLEAELANWKARVKQLEDLAAKLNAESGEFERQLQAPAAGVDEGVSVPAPDPDRAKGKTYVEYLCRKERLVAFPRDAILKRLSDDLEPATEAQIARAGKFTTWEGYMRWIERHLRGVKLDSDGIKVEIYVVAGGVRVGDTIRGHDLRIRYTLSDDKAGESLEEIAQLTSAFRQSLTALSSDSVWIRFSVFEDSFETYLRARAIAESMGFSVGWLAWAEDEDFGGSLVGSGGGSFSVAPD